MEKVLKNIIGHKGTWRNWYTRTSQKRMEQSLRVRLSPSPQYYLILNNYFIVYYLF